MTPDTFQISLCEAKLRQTRRREGCYLLRSNLTATDPARLWRYYIQLTEIEQAFKDPKNDLSLRPTYHQSDHRIAAHLFVAFIACCLQVTLKVPGPPTRCWVNPEGHPGKTVADPEVDAHFPTTDGRQLILPRYAQPDPDQQLLLQRLKLALPPQPPPRLRSRIPSVADVTPTPS